MSLSLNLGQKSGTDLSNSLLPEQTNLNTWLTQPSTDGKTLTNVKGTDVSFKDINALTFDGSDDLIQANNTTLGAGNFYYEIIFKYQTGDNQYIFIDGDTGVNDRWIGLFYTSGSGDGVQASFDSGTKETLTVFSSAQVSNNDIVKVILKRAGSTLEVEGHNLTQQGTQTDSSSNSGDFSGGNKLTIGGLWNGTGISNHAAFELYSFKAGTSETDLVVYYPCSEGLGDRVFDVSGTGNHATVTGATRSTESSNLIQSYNNQYGFTTNVITHKSAFVGTNITAVLNADDELVLTKTSSGTGNIILGLPIQLTGSVTYSYEAKNSQNGAIAQNIFLNDSGATFKNSSGQTVLGNSNTFNTFTSSGTVSTDQDIGFQMTNYSFFTNGETATIRNLTIRPTSGTYRIPALPNKTKQGYTADGVADEIEFNHSINASSDFEFESEFIVNDPSLSLQAVFSATGSTTNDRGMFIRYEAGSTRWLIKLGDTTYYISSHSIARGDVYKFNIKYHSSTQKVTVTMTKNGTTTTPIDNQDVTYVPDFNGQASLGSLRWSTSSPAGFTFKTCKFIQGTTTNVELDINNSAGLSTVADLSGNGNNGTLQSATLSLNWAKRYTDSDGIITNANYTGGDTDITNPSGYVHNGSECGLDLTTTDVSASDIASINNASATQTFAKRDATNSELVTQLLQYSSALSDAGELARTRAYVG